MAKVLEIRNVSKRHEMKLHVLPRGQMSFAASEIVSDPGHVTHLICCEKASRHLGPDHLHAGLALAVDPAAEAVRTELVVVDFPGQERFGLGSE